MNKISKEKRTQLILIGLVTCAIIAGLWFGLISLEKDKIGEISRKSSSVESEMAKMQKVSVETDQVAAALKEATNHLDALEGAMPSGDLFSGIVAAMRQFNIPSYKVDMPQFGPPSVEKVGMFGTFPYRQARLAVSGSAYYYDLGKFLADLENHFPYMRVQSLNLEPGFGTTPEEHEKLMFRMEIVTLVKPNDS
jgi:Tfp pilus assembly protein PilO